ncbi:MAG: ABC transporter ATP-binding protein [Bacteroidetes bacterium]|nr:ABC transporter ATP-binding protein [Bacteroidota bacterium]
MEDAIQFEKMIKEFSGFKLGPLNFTLEPGKVLGYIGPNGSGKTTTMQCLTGLLRPESGYVKIFGEVNDPNETGWKSKIGYVGDKHVFYENWSCARNLKFVSQFYPSWSDKRAEDLIKRFDLDANKEVAKLSKGNRAKLSLIQALAHDPQLLILDEPMDGLDPVIRSEFTNVLFEVIENEERAIFYSTHITSEIGRLCDELAFLDNGSLKLKTEKETLLEKWRTISFQSTNHDLKLPGVVEQKVSGNEFIIKTQDFESTLTALRELSISDITETRLSIEDIAIHILKGGRNVESL